MVNFAKFDHRTKVLDGHIRESTPASFQSTLIYDVCHIMDVIPHRFVDKFVPVNVNTTSDRELFLTKRAHSVL